MASNAMRMVVLFGPFDSCALLLLAPRIPLCRPIGMLSDLCTIIEHAMYTDDQSGNDNPNVFGSWPPYSTCFYQKSHI